MTITVSWERKLKGHSEIVMCSDSRLNGGGNIDVCQKIFPLPREDCAIGFCGSTLIAYPVINQFRSYILGYQKNLSRGLDASEIPRRFCDLVNEFLQSYMDAVDLVRELRETVFILSYFSWRLQRPFVYRVYYEASSRQYVPCPGRFPKSLSCELHRLGGFSMIGDYRHLYFRELAGLMNLQGARGFDMEPLHALCNMLRNPEYTDRRGNLRGCIGGAPQMLKIYPYMRTLEFGVYWPNKSDGNLYLNGRRSFDWEKITVPHMDAEDFSTFYPLAEVGVQHEREREG